MRVALLACASWAAVLLLPHHRALLGPASAVLVACTALLGSWLGDARARRALQDDASTLDAQLQAAHARLIELERANAHLEEELYRLRAGGMPAAPQQREAHWSDPRPAAADHRDGVSAARWPQQWHRTGPRAASRPSEQGGTPAASTAPPGAPPEPRAAQGQPASGVGPEASSAAPQRAHRSPSPRPDSEHEERSAQATSKHRAAVAAAAADAAALDAARATCGAELRACGAADAAHRGDVAALLAAVGAAPPVNVHDISSCQRALRSATARYHPDRVSGSGADVATRARSLEVCQLLQACRAVIESMHEQFQQQQAQQQQQQQQQQNGQQAPPPQPQPQPQAAPPAPSASDAYYKSAQAAAQAAEARLRDMIGRQGASAPGAPPGDTSAPRRPTMRAKRPAAVPGSPDGAPAGAGAQPHRRVFTAVRPMHVDA